MRAGLASLACLALTAVCVHSAAFTTRAHRGNAFVPHTSRKAGSGSSDATASLGAAAARRLQTNPFFNVVDYGAKGIFISNYIYHGTFVLFSAAQ